jgi:hypothetical protein
MFGRVSLATARLAAGIVSIVLSLALNPLGTAGLVSGGRRSHSGHDHQGARG